MLWCITSGYCCSEEICKTWGEYIRNLNNCRTNGATNRIITGCLSILSLFGLSNFYTGYSITGIFELVNGIMMLISISAYNICYDGNKRRHDNDASSCAQIVGTGIVILDLAKIIHIIYLLNTGSVEIIEIIVIILSIVTVCMHCDESNTYRGRSHGIVVTSQITSLTTILEVFRNMYVARYYDTDGNGCLFV